jgi:hypothetical protein
MVLGYAAATLGVGLTLARRSDRSLWWRFPGVFFLLHGAYGSGFAVGLVRFARAWREPAAPRPSPAAIAAPGRTGAADAAARAALKGSGSGS